MLGFREAGVIGVSVALAGGLAYIVWNNAFFSRESSETRPGDKGESCRERRRPAREKTKKEVVEKSGKDAEETVDARVETIYSAERARRVSEVTVTSDGHTFIHTSVMFQSTRESLTFIMM